MDPARPGDHATFSRLLLALCFGGVETPAELFWSTPIRARHAESLIATFERPIANARRCDPDGMIADALAAEAHGRACRFAVESRPPELAAGQP